MTLASGFASLLPYVDYFLPNEVEALHLTNADSVEEAADELSQLSKTIVVKRGKDGAIARSGSQVWLAPAFRIDSVETTGAGDCFNAGLLYALFEKGQTLPEALLFANGCGHRRLEPWETSASPLAADVERFIEARIGEG
jgi:sugar/nucleoside kinase (ribokinase family)